MHNSFDRGETASPRVELLHNIDPLTVTGEQPKYPNTFPTNVRAAIRWKDWKLLTGKSGEENPVHFCTFLFRQFRIHSQTSVLASVLPLSNVPKVPAGKKSRLKIQRTFLTGHYSVVHCPSFYLSIQNYIFVPKT